MTDPTQLASEQFDIGEIAIVVAAEFHPENIGCEVEIVGPLKERTSRQTGELFLAYQVRRQDGRLFGAKPNQLRKKRPPEWPSQEQLRQRVSWKDCAWKPENINV